MANLLPVPVRRSLSALRAKAAHVLRGRWPSAPGGHGSQTREDAWFPCVIPSGLSGMDVAENADSIRVRAAIPGMDQKDIAVELRDGRLVIKGARKSAHETKKWHCRYTEYSYGSFLRSAPLPCAVEVKKSRAEYKHGVLTVTLPKAREAQPKRVRVNVG